MAQGDPIIKLSDLDKKLTTVIVALEHQDEKLWGKDGFEGDIVRIHKEQARCADCMEELKKCASTNAGDIKVLKETKLGWRDWKFIVLVVLATAAAGGTGAGVTELLK